MDTAKLFSRGVSGTPLLMKDPGFKSWPTVDTEGFAETAVQFFLGWWTGCIWLYLFFFLGFHFLCFL